MKKCRVGVSITILFIILAICTAVCSCEPNGFRSDEDGLYCIVCHSFPTTDDFSYIERIGEDQYGRILFLYKTENDLFRDADGRDVYVYMIAQQLGTEEVSFYDLICSTVCRKKATDVNDPALFELLRRNDWGQPLRRDEMTSIPIKRYYKTIEYTDIKRIAEEIGVNQNYTYGSYHIVKQDIDVILIRTYSYQKESDSYTFETAYAACRNGKDEFVFTELDDIYCFPNIIASLLDCFDGEMTTTQVSYTE